MSQYSLDIASVVKMLGELHGIHGELDIHVALDRHSSPRP
ncbi:hypothetical protein Bra1253DRAFT_07154 [Bradyrhizobium sp. WSM1253]|nr:hypothetical protein Bra1253DRAFT_07154 [Bradyrhizobium sp. WSM1253]